MMENSGKKSVKTISFVMLITLAGKLLGLLRDRLLTVNYGSGAATNAFLTASRIPRVFFDAVFASAIAASFIPVFNELSVKNGRRDADRFAGNFISAMALITAVLTLLGTIFARPLVAVFADGYNAETAALCAQLTRIMFPTILFTGIAYSFVGILQSLDEFTIPALISVISNLLIIAYFVVFNDRFGITGLAVAYLIGWLLQAVIQLPSLRKKGFSFKPSLSFRSEGMKKVFTLMLPVMVSTWVQPINITINSKFGSRLFGGTGVSAIELSSNLYLIIVGVFVLSVTNVIFPKLARLSAGEDSVSFSETLRATLHSTLYFVFPMTAGLMVLAHPIVDLIYGGGQFDASAVSLTARALLFVALGMPGYAVQAVVCRAYFAEQNGKIPLVAGLVSIAVNVALCLILITPLDVAGLAIASAAAITVNAVILIIPLKKRGFFLFNKAAATDAVKSVFSALLTAAGAYGIFTLCDGRFGKAAVCFIPAAAGVVIYFIATRLFLMDEAVLVTSFSRKILSEKVKPVMQNLLHGSAVCRALSAVCHWISLQWKSSPIICWFLSTGRGEAMTGSSIFTHFARKLHLLWCRIFKSLSLDRATQHSIFRIPFFWCSATVALAPILPTLGIIALALVSAFSMLLCFGADSERRTRYVPANKFIVLYMVVYAVAVFTSVTVYGSLYGGAVTVLFIFFSLVFLNSIETKKQLEIMIWLVVLAGTLVAAYGIYQYVFGASGAEAWLDDDMFSDISTRVYSTLQNPNVLAEYLLLVIPFGIAGVIGEKEAFKKILFLCCTAAMGLCMILTFSRGGWLGLIFAVAIFFIILDRRFIIIGIAALAALYFILPDTIISRFTSIGNLADTSTSYRVSIWMGSLLMLRDYWFCGIGPGTAAFNMIYPAYSYNAAAAQHSHNLFLQITCDCGICGIILFLLAVFHSIKDVCIGIKNAPDKRSRYYLMASLSGTAGFLVQSMTDFSFYNYRMMLLFWAFLALGSMLARREKLPEA